MDLYELYGDVHLTTATEVWRLVIFNKLFVYWDKIEDFRDDAANTEDFRDDTAHNQRDIVFFCCLHVFETCW